ncbi:MAG: hypothetical protein HDS66_05835 [Bacteroidales bacterium]|nr:hypothetical protein [Bacteroidales bacterium]
MFDPNLEAAKWRVLDLIDEVKKLKVDHTNERIDDIIDELDTIYTLMEAAI